MSYNLLASDKLIVLDSEFQGGGDDNTLWTVLITAAKVSHIPPTSEKSIV
jgi:hypothetical protein